MDVGLKKPGVGKEERSSKMESSCVSVEEIVQKEDQLESTKSEMGEVREENERLKTLLARIAKDYQSLQMLFFDIVQQEQAKKPSETPSPGTPPQEIAEEPDQLVSLSLGTSPSLPKKEEMTNTSTSSSKVEDGLTLGLDCRFEAIDACTSPSNSVEEEEEEEPREPWPPSKILKSMRPSGGDAEEAEQQAHAKKTRVSVRARCDTPTMHDGCQWRKYGQKISKGNPCPRAYYRCTVAPCCPVKKQVQRCAEDMSILTTTYEGTHNHPLPISATAMASTTSAAASMLISGSTASSSLPTAPSSISSSLNFNLSDPINSRSRPFYLPNPTISSTPSYPTITLDLTSPPQTISQASQFSTRFSSSNFINTSGPRSTSTFNFSSSDSNPGLAPTSWANGSSYLSTYAAHNQPYTKSPISYLQSYLQKVANPSATGTQHTLTDSIAKAITSDPSFQSAMAAAITSYVGGPKGGQGGEEGASHGLQHSSLAPYTAPAGGNGCRSSFLARTGSGSGTNAPQGSLMLLQNPLGLSSSKSSSASPLDNRENIN